MALNRIPCPECGAGLKSTSGFTVGQNVCCPKCETYFAVEKPAEEAEENDTPKKSKASLTSTKAKVVGKKPLKATALPEDDEDDEDDEVRAKKKKKKKKRRDDDDQERSYKNSPLRYAVLGVLLIVMGVLAYFLYDKEMKKNAPDKETAKTDTENTTPTGTKSGIRPMGGPNMNFPQGGGGKVNVTTPKSQNGKQIGPLVPGGLLTPNPLTDAEKKQLLAQYKTQLPGTWKADLGDGVTAQLVYTAGGQLTELVTSPKGTQTTTGTWTATNVTNRKTLLVMVVWSGMTGANKPVELIFEDDELQHPVLGQGATGIFRKV